MGEGSGKCQCDGPEDAVLGVTARSSDMRLSTRPSSGIKQGMKLIKKENDRYIDPKSGGKTNENKKR